MEKCSYAKVQCMHSGCGALVPRDDLPRHLTEDCNFRQVFCQLCKLETTADQLKVTFLNESIKLGIVCLERADDLPQS